jgi:concanavalin A-like lectin/glucanase superfamily protein
VAAVLLLVGDDFTDKSPEANTVTPTGSVVSSNEWGQFGNSLKFTGGHLTITPVADFLIGTGDFTAEGRIKLGIGANPGTVLWCIGTYGFADGYYLDITDGTPNLTLHVGGLTPFAGLVITATHVASDFTAANGAHVAVSRQSGTIRLFVNGVQKGSASSSIDVQPTRVRVGDMNFHSGADSMGTFPVNAYVDEFRVSNTAVYTGAFTPPAETFLTGAVTGFKPISFGTPAVQPRAVGFKAASFGTPFAVYDAMETATGFTPTSFGAPAGGYLQPVTGFAPMGFGTPSILYHAAGFKPVTFGSPQVAPRVVGFNVASFGTVTGRNAHRVRSAKCVTHFGRPIVSGLAQSGSSRGSKRVRFGRPTALKFYP